MRIALLPFDIAWEDPTANLQYLSGLLASRKQDADLWILPEMFNSGFSMEPERFAESMEGPTVLWMKDQARVLKTAITGSIAVKTPQGYYNRMLFVHPDGKIDWYDKRHLFRYSGEDRSYLPGTERKIVEYRGWRILLQICYDLRFPVFTRNREDYDLLLYVANWPSPRAHHWEALVRARAIENQSYVAAVNRTGMDGNELAYSGISMLCRYDGEALINTGNAPGVFCGELDLGQLQSYRKRFPFLRDADAFRLD